MAQAETSPNMDLSDHCQFGERLMEADSFRGRRSIPTLWEYYLVVLWAEEVGGVAVFELDFQVAGRYDDKKCHIAVWYV